MVDDVFTRIVLHTWTKENLFYFGIEILCKQGSALKRFSNASKIAIASLIAEPHHIFAVVKGVTIPTSPQSRATITFKQEQFDIDFKSGEDLRVCEQKRDSVNQGNTIKLSEFASKTFVKDACFIILRTCIGPDILDKICDEFKEIRMCDM